jgi:hypothetical protein
MQRRHKPGIKRLVPLCPQEGFGDEDGKDQTRDDQPKPVGLASPLATRARPDNEAKSRFGLRRDLLPTIVFSLNNHEHYGTEVSLSRPRGYPR